MEPPLLFMHILFEAILNTNLPRSKEVLRDTLLHINNLECSFNSFFFFPHFSQHSDSLITPVTFEKMSPHWLRSIPQTAPLPKAPWQRTVATAVFHKPEQNILPQCITVCGAMRILRIGEPRTFYRFGDLNMTEVYPERFRDANTLQAGAAAVEEAFTF